eukprot:361775-Chlamydomonas_euryale.AAC.13
MRRCGCDSAAACAPRRSRRSSVRADTCRREGGLLGCRLGSRAGLVGRVELWAPPNLFRGRRGLAWADGRVIPGNQLV